jgi:hypothetical protein
LHDGRPALLNFGEPDHFDIAKWVDCIQSTDAHHECAWEIPILDAVTAPTAVLIRPDGYVACVADLAQARPAAAHFTWFGPPADAYSILYGVLMDRTHAPAIVAGGEEAFGFRASVDLA